MALAPKTPGCATNGTASAQARRRRGSDDRSDSARGRVRDRGAGLVLGWQSAPRPDRDAVVPSSSPTSRREPACASSTSAARRPEHQLPETMGSGLAWLDFDRDGWMDLYVVQSGKFPPAASRPRTTASTATAATEPSRTSPLRAGIADGAYGMGAIAADYDNDGKTDLFVTNFGRNILYRNRGDGTFEDVTAKAGVAGSGWSTSAAFCGLRRRRLARPLRRPLLGLLGREEPLLRRRRPRAARVLPPPSILPASNLLYRNSGNGTFRTSARPPGSRRRSEKGSGSSCPTWTGTGGPTSTSPTTRR